MNIDDTVDGFIPDADITAFVRLMRRDIWYYAPYGWWTEASGDHVVFDRGYHPICRVLDGGVVEIVEPDTWIDYVTQRFFSNASASRCAKTRRVVSRVVVRLGIAEEIRRRRMIGQLPHATPPDGWRPGRKRR